MDEGRLLSGALRVAWAAWFRGLGYPYVMVCILMSDERIIEFE